MSFIHLSIATAFHVTIATATLHMTILKVMAELEIYHIGGINKFIKMNIDEYASAF